MSFIVLAILVSLFSCPLVAQTPAVVNSIGEFGNPNEPLPPATPPGMPGHPIYLFPNAPSYAQAQADGACQAQGGSNSESATVTLMIPDTYPNCGLYDWGWVAYTYYGQNNCPPFTWTFTLEEAGGGTVAIDPATGLYPVKPGGTYTYTVAVSTGNGTCEIDYICPTPLIVKTDFTIEHSVVNANNSMESLYKFDSKDLLNFLSKFKVSADGTQGSLFEIKMSNSFPNNGCAHDFLLRIKEDPNGTNEDQYGKFGAPIPTATGAKFEYTHPKFLPLSNSDSYEEYHVEMVYASDPSKIVDEIDFRVYRIPVLMVHGLWSEDGAFGKMKDEFDDDYYDGFLLHRANYKNTHAATFADNAGVVPAAIDKLLEKVKKEKVAVRKVDIVGHSMGGLLTRVYQQSGFFGQNIARIVTLNSPHSGSQLADLLLDTNFVRSETLRTWLNRFGKNPNGGAIDNLRVEGPIINNFLNGGNQSINPLPSHAVITLFDCPVPTGFFQRLSLCGAFQTVVNLNDLFNNEQHDMIVAQSSQQGGLALGASTTVVGMNHMDSPENASVITTTLNLLREPVNSALFSTAGFNPPVLDYVTPPQFAPPVASGEKSLATLTINTPADSLSFAPGSTFPVSVSGSADIVEINVSVSYAVDSLYFAIQTGNSFSASFMVDSVSGERKLVAMGKTATGEILLDSITFFVCPENYVLNDQIISTASFSAANDISSNGSIEDESSVRFRAGVSIHLNAGFEVQNGATLDAGIGECEGATNLNEPGGGGGVKGKKKK